MTKAKKIVLTGAPSSGKSSSMAELTRLYGGRVALIPESAVVLLSGGFPAPAHDDLEQIRGFQRAIITVQENLELIIERRHPAAALFILDRAKLDGAGFWPPGPEDYFRQFAVDPAKEFLKYDHVLFLELPALESFGGVNQRRFHNYEQSLESERRLRQVWSRHPGFVTIPAKETLESKVGDVVQFVRDLIKA
jgi:predicted ATPase